MSYFLIILKKDVLLLARRPEYLLSMLGFFVATLTIIYFSSSQQRLYYYLSPLALKQINLQTTPSLPPQLSGLSTSKLKDFITEIKAVTPQITAAQLESIVRQAKTRFSPASIAGYLWLCSILASILSLVRSFSAEQQNGVFSTILIAPLPRWQLFLAKTFANWVLLGGMISLNIPLTLFIFDVQYFSSLVPLLGLAALGSAGLSLLGTLLAAMVSTVNGREVIFPLLLFPLITPLILGLVQSSALIISGTSQNLDNWLYLVLIFDAIFLVLGLLLFEYVVES